MQIKIDMNLEDTLRYFAKLNEHDDYHKFNAVIDTLVTEFNNIEARMKNAEKELLRIREPLAVGKSPKECLTNFCQEKGWLAKGTPAMPEDNQEVEMGEELGFNPDAPELTWGYRFEADGDHFKGAGMELNGYYILLWLK